MAPRRKNVRFSLLGMIAPSLPGAASAACDSSDYLVVARTIRMVADGVRRRIIQYALKTSSLSPTGHSGYSNRFLVRAIVIEKKKIHPLHSRTFKSSCTL